MEETHFNILKSCGLDKTEKVFDYSFPLQNYWIASSHNTYLTEDQLIGPASACGYINFLNTFQGGCLEIDPAYVETREVGKETFQDVSITHVFTQTGKTYFSDVLGGIRTWLQENQSTVIGCIILSFDNKTITSAKDHAVIWQLLDKYINLNQNNAVCQKAGDCSWYFNPADITEENRNNLTPETLRGKIIIKWDECREIGKNGKCADKHLTKALIAKPLTSMQDNVVDDNGNSLTVDKERFVHMPKSNSCKLHKSYCSDEKHQFWNVSSKETPFAYHPVSLQVLKNTVDNFVRVFPNPFQLDKLKSSNYPQMGSWLNGAQMVAINTQKQDRDWQINFTMFRDTPYRLKPKWMRTKQDIQAHIQTPLVDLMLQFEKMPKNAAAFRFYHPSGEAKQPKTVSTDRRILFKEVDPTLVIVYVEVDDFVGAVEIPSSTEEMIGTTTLSLYRWLRPTVKGIKYMGPNCNYEARQEKCIEHVLRFIWSSS